MAAKIERSINHSLRELEPRRGGQPGRRLRIRTGSLEVLAGFSLAESELFRAQSGKASNDAKGERKASMVRIRENQL